LLQSILPSGANATSFYRFTVKKLFEAAHKISDADRWP